VDGADVEECIVAYVSNTRLVGGDGTPSAWFGPVVFAESAVIRVASAFVPAGSEAATPFRTVGIGVTTATRLLAEAAEILFIRADTTLATAARAAYGAGAVTQHGPAVGAGGALAVHQTQLRTTGLVILRLLALFRTFGRASTTRSHQPSSSSTTTSKPPTSGSTARSERTLSI
jgi:hypothetical protein